MTECRPCRVCAPFFLHDKLSRHTPLGNKRKCASRCALLQSLTVHMSCCVLVCLPKQLEINTPSRLRDSILFPKLFSANMCVPCSVPYFMFDFAVCSFVNLLDTSPCSCELCN